MKKSDQVAPYNTPQRQSTAAIIIFVYNFVVRILRGFWPVLLVILFRSGQKQSNTELALNAVILIGGSVSLFVSIVSYFRYFFHLEADRLVIQKGVFNRTRIRLPFERIQNIRIEQKVLHRMLNVVSLRIDSAGSSGSEITVEALERHKAEDIRQYVLSQKREGFSSSSQANGEDYSAQVQPQSLILRLNVDDLLRVGASQNHLRTAGIIVGSVFGFLFTLADTLQLGFMERIPEYMPGLRLGFPIYLSLAITLIVIAFIITVLRTISRYYDLRFYEDRNGFSLRAGLFNRKETSLRKEKIQIIRWLNNPIRRALGIYQLNVLQATSGGSSSDLVTIPGCRQNQVDDVVWSSFAGVDRADYEAHGINRAYVYWYFRFLGLAPLLVFSALAYFLSEPRFLLPAGFIPPFVYWYLDRYQRSYRLYLNPDFVKTFSGVIGHEYSILPAYKVQSIDVQSSFYQRRRGLADLVIYTAGGSETIPFLELDKANALQDYLLYRVETSAESWM